MLVNLINGFNLNSSPKYSLSVNNKINQCNNSLSNQSYKDSFVFTKQNIAFTSSHIPKKELLSICDEAMSKVEELTTTEKISALADEIRLKRNELSKKTVEYVKNNFPEEKEDIIDFCYDKLINKSIILDTLTNTNFYKRKIGKYNNIAEGTPDGAYVPYFKNDFISGINSIKNCIETYETKKANS